MLRREISGWTARRVIGDKVDVPLSPQMDLLGTVIGDVREAHGGENGFQHARLGRGELDELESVEA